MVKDISGTLRVLLSASFVLVIADIEFSRRLIVRCYPSCTALHCVTHDALDGQSRSYLFHEASLRQPLQAGIHCKCHTCMHIMRSDLPPCLSEIQKYVLCRIPYDITDDQVSSHRQSPGRIHRDGNPLYSSNPSSLEDVGTSGEWAAQQQNNMSIPRATHEPIMSGSGSHAFHAGHHTAASQPDVAVAGSNGDPDSFSIESVHNQPRVPFLDLPFLPAEEVQGSTRSLPSPAAGRMPFGVAEIGVSADPGPGERPSPSARPFAAASHQQRSPSPRPVRGVADVYGPPPPMSPAVDHSLQQHIPATRPARGVADLYSAPAPLSIPSPQPPRGVADLHHVPQSQRRVSPVAASPPPRSSSPRGVADLYRSRGLSSSSQPQRSGRSQYVSSGSHQSRRSGDSSRRKRTSDHGSASSSSSAFPSQYVSPIKNQRQFLWFRKWQPSCSFRS